MRLVDQRTQRVVETWPLPSGRWWAPGEEKRGSFGLSSGAIFKAWGAKAIWGRVDQKTILLRIPKKSHQFKVFS